MTAQEEEDLGLVASTHIVDCKNGLCGHQAYMCCTDIYVGKTFIQVKFIKNAFSQYIYHVFQRLHNKSGSSCPILS